MHPARQRTPQILHLLAIHDGFSLAIISSLQACEKRCLLSKAETTKIRVRSRRDRGRSGGDDALGRMQLRVSRNALSAATEYSSQSHKSGKLTSISGRIDDLSGLVGRLGRCQRDTETDVFVILRWSVIVEEKTLVRINKTSESVCVEKGG